MAMKKLGTPLWILIWREYFHYDFPLMLDELEVEPWKRFPFHPVMKFGLRIMIANLSVDMIGASLLAFGWCYDKLTKKNARYRASWIFYNLRLILSCSQKIQNWRLVDGDWIMRKIDEIYTLSLWYDFWLELPIDYMIYKQWVVESWKNWFGFQM